MIVSLKNKLSVLLKIKKNKQITRLKKFQFIILVSVGDKHILFADQELYLPVAGLFIKQFQVFDLLIKKLHSHILCNIATTIFKFHGF